MTRATEIDVRFYVKGAATSLLVRSVRGRGPISELFRFEVDLVGDDDSLDLDASVGEAAHVVIRWGGNGAAYRRVDSVVELEASHEGTRYQVELVPRGGVLDRSAGCRVFSEITAPELIERVLSEHGVTDVRRSLTDTYATRDIIVQYQETDWALLSRWMEAEGIRYFFEHSAEGYTLVITDAPTTHDEIDGDKVISYREETLDAGENVLTFQVSRRIVPSRVTVRDYPLDDPRGSKQETAEAKESGNGSAFVFPAQGAKKRLDALRLPEKTGRGSASSIRLSAGRAFELDSHPRSGYNADWLVTAIEHEGIFRSDGQSNYSVSFECVPRTTPYRPARRATRRSANSWTATRRGRGEPDAIGPRAWRGTSRWWWTGRRSNRTGRWSCR